MPSWPSTLPTALLVAGLQHQPIPNATVVPPEAGELLTRRRFTGRMTRIQGAMLLTTAQYNALLDFYYDTLGETQPFEWTDPATGDTVDMMFDGAPQAQPVATDIWQTTVTLLTKPAAPGGSP